MKGKTFFVSGFINEPDVEVVGNNCRQQRGGSMYSKLCFSGCV